MKYLTVLLILIAFIIADSQVVITRRGGGAPPGFSWDVEEDFPSYDWTNETGTWGVTDGELTASALSGGEAASSADQQVSGTTTIWAKMLCSNFNDYDGLIIGATSSGDGYLVNIQSGDIGDVVVLTMNAWDWDSSVTEDVDVDDVATDSVFCVRLIIDGTTRTVSTWSFSSDPGDTTGWGTPEGNAQFTNSEPLGTYVGVYTNSISSTFDNFRAVSQ